MSEGSNLYYTNARADARIAAASTSDLSEGTNLYYTDARADARVALIVDSAPGTLNTLNELAAALGDDANFSTTVTNSIAAKLPLAGGTMSGNLTVEKSANPTFTVTETGAGAVTIQGTGSGGRVYSNSGNKLLLGANGQNAHIIVNTTGTVGIGAGTNPTSKLQVEGSMGTTPLVLMKSLDTTANDGAVLKLDASGRGGGIVDIDIFGVHNYDGGVFHIRNNGNVGIGTGSPDYPLHISGTGSQRLRIQKTDAGGDADLQLYSPSDSTQWILFGDSTSGNNSGVIKYVHSTNKMHFRTNDVNDRLVISSDGNVGIGTDSPDALLHVSATSPHIDIGPQGGNRGKIGYHSNDVIIGSTSSTGNIIFKNNISSTDSPQTSGDVKMTIADGNVNIANKLGINIASDSTAIFRAGWASSGTTRPSTLYSAMIETNSDHDGLGLFTTNDRNVKIIFGSPTNNVGGQIVYYTDTSAPHMKFFTKGSEVMALKEGKVGIGTDSPTQKLDVAGTALVENAKLKAIAESNTDTAVDVFVYDTRKDSDGGAWRKRTQNTSWYNETLEYSTRGARKEFPCVAVIVATRSRSYYL